LCEYKYGVKLLYTLNLGYYLKYKAKCVEIWTFLRFEKDSRTVLRSHV